VRRLFGDPPPLPPFKEGAFPSRLHDERIAARLGIALGIAFGLCFVTGVLSHLIQQPPSWFAWPSRPAGLYRLTQGVHVASGIIAIPLLFAKLWTVYPHLWTWPPFRTFAHALERISLFPLIGGGLFLLMSGLLNIAGWYPWPFFFPAAHYWAAWITIGALVVHVGAKLPVTRRAIFTRGTDDLRGPPASEGLTRRGFLVAVAGAAGAVTVATLGQTWNPLRALSVLAPRDPAVGPQGLPINKTAFGAGVRDSAVDPAWRLVVEGDVRERLELSLDDLRRMPQQEAVLPIACVEGWSAEGRWRGVRVRELLERAGARPDAAVVVESLQRRGRYRTSELNASHASDPQTLLALELNGEPLHLDHGFPARLIGPNRPGVMQTKWVSKLIVT
jgi:DMSO/TMAO reductase YedYZ molybdopterin-dependent catalytic subunit